MRCLRPTAFCACASLPPVASRTRVVLLQHPREARLAICSAWLTRIALSNVELHRGVRFAGDARVAEVVANSGTALLFPGDGASAPEDRADDPPAALVVIDATWKQAERMLRDNPAIAALPRIALAGSRPSGYRTLRREPGPGCLPTIEAVALALGAFERNEDRFAPMIDAFRRGVSLQLECTRAGRRNPRHRTHGNDPTS